MKGSEKDLSADPELVSAIAIGAIKYSILKQAPGRDIVFDIDTATSFEGDSGPYLQYTAARIHSLLGKGKGLGIFPKLSAAEDNKELTTTCPLASPDCCHNYFFNSSFLTFKHFYYEKDFQ